MSQKYEPHVATLLYGEPGAGKTFLGCSSFYDYGRQKLIANGKLITFGAEDNPVLGIPEECRMIGNNTSLRLTVNPDKPQEFLNTLKLILMRIMKDAKEGNPLDVLVIDSISELNWMFQSTDTKEGYAKWLGLRDEFYSLVSSAHPSALGCSTIITARVRAPNEDDPSYRNYKYYPAIDGSFRQQLGAYFGMVLYQEAVAMQATEGPYKGKRIPVHLIHMLQGGDFLVKNQYEHNWMTKELPITVENPIWPVLWSLLTGSNLIIPKEEE